LYKDPKTGSISTQFTMDLIEECGLVKMDFLGLKTLTLINNTVDLIKKGSIDFDIEKIPENDAPTFEMLGDGKSTCIFQFESIGMQGILKRAKPNKIEDLIALNALYRPGPMDNIDQFIDSKSGKKPIKYPLPELEPILRETYGVIVYQEQVMEIARVVAGYSLGQADILRRAMGKKKREVMARQKIDFVQGALKKGFSKKQAEDIFELLIPFAGYGFNKSHAAAYSLLAYKTAYLKANFPAEFMAANLTNEINSTEKLAEYISETRGMGIHILPPDINLSDKMFTVSNGKIVYGLKGIKNVGTTAVDEIIRVRKAGGPYKSIMDFFDRVDLKVVNKKAIESLIEAGLFDSISNGRAILFHNLERLLEFASHKKESKKYGQASLFQANEMEEFGEPELEYVEEWPPLELLRHEKINLGFYFSGHPLDKYRKIWEDPSILKLAHLERALKEKVYSLVGMVRNLREIQTKNGRRMVFALLEDFEGSAELIMFPDLWESVREKIAPEVVLGIRGKIDTAKGEPKIIVEELREPEELIKTEPAELHIRISGDQCSEDDLYHLRSFLFDHKGNCAVYLHIGRIKNTREVVIKASSQLCVSPEDNVIEELKNNPKIEKVWRT
ncbi:MAG: DNA polymerase III subunit alpha, partial [Spirochaetota bacterium]